MRLSGSRSAMMINRSQPQVSRCSFSATPSLCTKSFRLSAAQPSPQFGAAAVPLRTSCPATWRPSRVSGSPSTTLPTRAANCHSRSDNSSGVITRSAYPRCRSICIFQFSILNLHCRYLVTSSSVIIRSARPRRLNLHFAIPLTWSPNPPPSSGPPAAPAPSES